MKKTAALLLSFLLLTACARAPDLREPIRERYAGGYGGTAVLTADYGPRLFECTVDFDLAPEGGTVTVTAPETIAGIVMTYDAGGNTLSFGGASVFTGHLTAEGLSPSECLPMMLTCWRQGTVTAWESAAEGFKITYYVSPTASLETFFDPETLEPLSAQVWSGGRAVLTCRFITKE